MKPSSKLLEHLKSVTAASIEKMSVFYGNRLYPDYDDLIFDIEDALPSHGKLIEELEQYIPEYPAFEFLSNEINRILKDRYPFQNTGSKIKLNKLPGYNETKHEIISLIDLLFTLPWKYKATIKLNDKCSFNLPEGKNSYYINENISLIKPDETFKSKHPLETENEELREKLSLNGIFSGERHDNWNDQSLHLQIKTDGYIAQHSDNYRNEIIESNIKSFYGIAIAVDMFELRQYVPTHATEKKYYTHIKKNGKWHLNYLHDISRIDASSMEGIRLSLTPQWSASENEKFIHGALPKIRNAFSNTDTSIKLVLAGQWFFESYTTRDPLLAFVKAMVVLEIILGDKRESDKTGLGALLKNRCAYLIGQDHADRIEIMEIFDKTYDIRSRIVHRGYSRLTNEEKNLFIDLRHICHRVIQEEIRLIT